MMRVLSVACLMAAQFAMAQEVVTRDANLMVDVARDGRVAMDAAGDIWIVPKSGGDAVAVTSQRKTASRPRWSPDARHIAYQSNEGGVHSIWIHEVDGDNSHRVSHDDSFDMHPEWHPDAQRIVYAKDDSGQGFDLWEVDLPTGLHWRLSNRRGDEIEPAWSANGRDLVYVHHDGADWSLILRQHGQPEETLLTTTDRLAGPSWRPDGSLITFLRVGETGTVLDMVILSRPRLLRNFDNREDYVLAPVSWLDRQRIIYSAGGRIRQRAFNSWTSRTLRFRATITAPPAVAVTTVERRELESVDEPVGVLVVHAARLFDGLGEGYLADHDIVIEGGRITAVGPHSDHPSGIVIDMGDLTVMPGFIDARAEFPGDADEAAGPLLLATGVTTLAADHPDLSRLNRRWSGKQLPGPRLLADDGRLDGDLVALADSTTPGVGELLASRQARWIGAAADVPRRFAEPPSIEAGRTSIVAGSRGNRFGPGIALHAELRAMTAAGLQPAQALRAAGVNAAAALGLDPFLGRVSVGGVADLVFVDGDPLVRVEDALNVVAVLRNGRFFSVAGLVERATPQGSVE